MTIDVNVRKEPETTLQEAEVHDVWSQQFRSGENDAFFRLAFDRIAEVYGAPDGPAVIDAGSGTGTKSFELARRGYRVCGLDFSELAVERAKAAARSQRLADRVDFVHGDLTRLPLPTAGASRVLCWGVVMHVPDIGAAVTELARILAPGGILVISEANVRSLQAVLLRTLKKLLRRERAEIVHAEAGIEFWEETSAGRLMTRQTDIRWLVAEFEKRGLELVERRAGQFTEIYVVLPWRPLRRLVHAFNNSWFRFPGLPGPAFGNLLVFRRTKD